MGGSTWPGEERLLCEIYRRLKPACPDLALVLVPRHAERAPEVVAELEQQQLAFLRRSRLNDRMEPAERPDVLLVDSTGELSHFYAHADLIFIGKSLLHHGGQHPIEAALCAKAIVVGPHMENFPAVMPPFLEAGAIEQVGSPEELEARIKALLADDSTRKRLGEKALRVVVENRGAIQRTVELLQHPA
jgi:3-deoxy-D-manno-octulosonic-acid transferase